MAIVVGTNSYLTLERFKELAVQFGDSYPADDVQLSAALSSSALKFIDPNYSFKGVILDESQVMELPTDAVAIADIELGAYQAALQAANGELFIAPTANSAGQVTSVRKKLDVLETQTDYNENSASYYTHDTTQIDRFMRPYIVFGGGDMGKLRKC